MGTDVSHKLIGWILAVTCVVSILWHVQGPAPIVNAQQRNAEIRGACTNRDNGRLFARTELFFGRAKPDGSMVTDEEFHSFLDEIITPRFPNGLTALPGTGQFRRLERGGHARRIRVCDLALPSGRPGRQHAH